jgi:hypothetical protein
MLLVDIIETPDALKIWAALPALSHAMLGTRCLD